jgi:tRNA(fMet)-specific endonuclease VapC
VFLLDTNTCVRFLTGRSERVCERVLTTDARDIALCSVVKAELIYGSVKSEQMERNQATLAEFFGRFISLPFDDTAAAEYGIIRAHLERSGRPIGSNDLMIAAIALSRGTVLVTHNTREFSRVEGLQLDDWE